MSYFPQANYNAAQLAARKKIEDKLQAAAIKSEKKKVLDKYIKDTREGVSLAIWLAEALGKSPTGSVSKQIGEQTFTFTKNNLKEFEKQINERIKAMFGKFNEYKKRTGGAGGQNAPALFDQSLLTLYRDTRVFPVARNENCDQLGAPLNNFLLFTQPSVINGSGQQVRNPVYGIFQQGTLMKIMALYLLAAAGYQKLTAEYVVPLEMKQTLNGLFNKITTATADKFATKRTKGTKTVSIVPATFNTDSFPVSHFPKVNGAARLRKPTAEESLQISQYGGADKVAYAIQSGVQLSKEEIEGLNPVVYTTFKDTPIYGNALHANGITINGYNSNGLSAIQVLLEIQKRIISDTFRCVQNEHPELLEKKKRTKKTA